LILVRVDGIQKPERQTLLVFDDPVSVGNVLVLAILRRSTEDALHGAGRSRPGDIVAAVGQFHLQKRDRHGVDVGSVTRNLDSSGWESWDGSGIGRGWRGPVNPHADASSEPR